MSFSFIEYTTLWDEKPQLLISLEIYEEKNQLKSRMNLRKAMFAISPSYSQEHSERGYLQIYAYNIVKKLNDHCVPLIWQRPDINKNDIA